MAHCWSGAGALRTRRTAARKASDLGQKLKWFVRGWQRDLNGRSMSIKTVVVCNGGGDVAVVAHAIKMSGRGARGAEDIVRLVTWRNDRLTKRLGACLGTFLRSHSRIDFAGHRSSSPTCKRYCRGQFEFNQDPFCRTPCCRRFLCSLLDR